jgi:hypothetical protein
MKYQIRRPNQLGKRPRLLSTVKMLGDNIHMLPKGNQEFARSLVASACHRDHHGVGLSDAQLLQVDKLNARIMREKGRLGNGTPKPPTSGTKGSETVARRTNDGIPRGAAKPKRSPKGRSAAAGAGSAS